MSVQVIAPLFQVAYTTLKHRAQRCRYEEPIRIDRQQAACEGLLWVAARPQISALRNRVQAQAAA